MSGWKEWEFLERVSSSEFQSYLQDQVVQVYATSTARSSALGTAVSEGMISYLSDSNAVQYYDGSAWVSVSNPGDITAVSAGTALTGGGSSGDVTLNVNLSAVNIPAAQINNLGTGVERVLTTPTYATTVTSASPVTLTAASAMQQFFTGSTAQTVLLPVASTMTLGQRFLFHNNSSNNITIQSSGANNVGALTAGQTAQVTCVLTSGTTAASWDFDVTGATTTTGSGALVFGGGPSLTSPVLSTPQLTLSTTASTVAGRLSVTGSTLRLGNGSSTLTFTDDSAITIPADRVTTPVNTLAAATTAYTVLATDKNDIIYSLGTATCTVTVPDLIAIGDRIDIVRDGAGTVVIAAGTGVTSWAGAGTAGTAVTFKIDQQFNAATVLKVAANTYRVIGRIIP